MVLSYLVSTAGHAQYQNDQHPHDIWTILQLIDEGAEEMGDEKVVGFTSVSEKGEWRCDRLSYRQLISQSTAVAHDLIKAGIPINESGEDKIVSLLCPTGLEFLLNWIAGMRLGYGVVFVAPQCSPSAIIHLYQSTSSTHLIYHPKYSNLAEAVLKSHSSARLVPFPAPSSSTCQDQLPAISINPSSVSHVFHTSGTSGTPKPIPNTHSGSMSVLPRRAIPAYLPTASTRRDSSSTSDQAALPPSESAAFTTTPLFHGGVSDLLRAWMARSMIYFYPTSDVSITTRNVVASVEACHQPLEPLDGIDTSVEERMKRFRVTAFLSVPYILSVLAEDINGTGIEMLQSMRFVSTGGAPLDTAIGDAMVKTGVRLVSRLGSSECGFLLSSHRDYDAEKDWELLRNDSPYGDALVFEPQIERSATGTQRYEMIVTNRWASKTKTNRDDGSYATGDLYEKHPSKSDVWRYVGRGDDVIVMSNGEKASPGPIESTLRSSPHLSDALLVGADRLQLGVLLFPTSPPGPSDLLDLLRSVISEANTSSPSFAQIAPEMCMIITNPERISALPKSSKGTIRRGVANDTYREEINSLYNGTSAPSSGGKRQRSTGEISTFVGDLVNRVAGAKNAKSTLDETADLFSWGVDSLMATRIRTALQKELIVGEKPLPGNVVFEHPSIAKLSKYLYDRQEGIDQTSDTTEATLSLMRELAEKYGDFSCPNSHSIATPNKSSGSDPSRSSGLTILLTGATGSLGSFLLHQLATLPEEVIERVICFVRAESHEEAHRRVTQIIEKRGLTVGEKRFIALAADVSRDQLGLDVERYSDLVRSVDVVIHAAWPVHFASSLISFKDQIRGTRNLINLIHETKRPDSRFLFCSSIASVLGGPSSFETVTENWSEEPSTASPIGYSQSKWVTEAICHRANQQPGIESDSPRGRVQVLRIGQLCGDTLGGYWNEKEGWPLLLRTAETTGSLPLLTERPSWLPVDLASRAILDIVLDESATEPVYHIVHPKHVEWTTVLDGMSASGIPFERVSPQEWLGQVRQSLVTNGEDPSAQMLSLWESAYDHDTTSDPISGISEPTVNSDKAQGASKTLRVAPRIDIEMMRRMVDAWRATGFFTSCANKHRGADGA